jgi:hypothetical protein
MAVNPKNVLVTDFGAVGNNTADDGPAIREAHNYCATHRSGSYLPLHFPIGRYLIASGSGIPLKRDMHWTGEGHAATETDTRVQIRFNSDHLFKFESGVNADWVTMTGICFDGRNQSKSLLEPANITDPNSRIIYHSLFQQCGFKNFASVFDGRLSGVRVLNNFFQNNKIGFRASGADNIIEDNYMSGSNWKAGGNSDPGGGPETFAVELGSFRLCRFNKNYITGWPQQHLKLTGSGEGSIFFGNWFDITDQCGVYATNSAGGVFIGNSFNRCMLGQDPSKPASSGTKDPDHDAFVRMKNCEDFGFYGNSFGYIDNGLPAGDPVKTFHLTDCENIDTEPNVYRRPYKKLLVND